MRRDGAPVLVVEGDTIHLADWRHSAQKFSVEHVETVAEIPMDRRHRSKIDRAQLAAWPIFGPSMRVGGVGHNWKQPVST